MQSNSLRTGPFCSLEVATEPLIQLRSLNQDRDGEQNSTEMETKHTDYVNSLIISPDNRRIISGGDDQKLLIHDTNT